MSTPTTQARPDTWEMVVVHDVFRREFGNLPGLVRGVAPGDTARAGVVAGFARELMAGLHHHHTSEDALLWPPLLERATADAALVLRMEEQHDRIAALHDRAAGQLAAFEAAAGTADGERLAATLTALAAALDEHLREEEDQILPLVEEHLTVAEWEALGERGRAGIPKDRQLVQVGFILLGRSPAERAAFLAQLPVAARLAWRLLGRRSFEAEYRRIYGHAPEL